MSRGAYFTLQQRLVRNLIKHGGTLTKRQLTKAVNRVTANQRTKALHWLSRRKLVTLYQPDMDNPLAWSNGITPTLISVTPKGILWFKGETKE